MRRKKTKTYRCEIFGIDDFLVGMVGGAVIDAVTGHNANQQNVELANAQRAFNKEHAMNAHQWEVQDLMKAGLNPMLSFRGSGAPLNGSVPGSVEPLTRNSSEKMTSALMARQQAQGIQAGIEKTTAEKKLADQNTLTSAAEARKRNIEALILEGYGGAELQAKIKLMDQQRLTSAAEAEHAGQQVTNLKAELPKIQAEIRNIGAMTDKTTTEQIKAAVETDLHQLEYTQRQAVQEDIIHMIKVERQKMDLSLPGAKNRAAAQDAGWRQILAKLGFTKGEQDEIIERSVGTAAYLRGMPK